MSEELELYDIRQEGDEVGDNDDAWTVHKVTVAGPHYDSEDTDDAIAICATETLANVLVAMLNSDSSSVSEPDAAECPPCPPARRRLPTTRQSITHKFSIGGHEGYLTVGLFEDGSPGELFIKMAKAGSTLSGLADTVGILVSMSLQYGVPMETLYEKFKGVKFDPSGITHNPDIRDARSMPDYVFRWLHLVFNPTPEVLEETYGDQA